MDHVAIMQPSWGLLPKIISGEKTIESRWYLSRRAPWDNVVAGDTVYFKNSGQPITTRATVAHVRQFADLTPGKVRQLLDAYGRRDGIAPGEVAAYYERFKSKRYCILVFLERAESVVPFQIDKTGFGDQAAWLTVEAIDELRPSRV